MADKADKDVRECPSCGAPLFAAPDGVVDLADGGVEFDCRACGVRLRDNRERTAVERKEEMTEMMARQKGNKKR